MIHFLPFKNLKAEFSFRTTFYLITSTGAPGEEKPKKKKSKRDCLQALKKQKNDPNAPGPTRMPFPDLKDVDKAERAKALKEMTRRQTLSAG